MAGSCLEPFDLTFQRPIGLFIKELVTCINTTANSDLEILYWCSKVTMDHVIYCFWKEDNIIQFHIPFHVP